jgi:hypothetical protein
MADSILTDTKKVLGIDEDYTAFDPDVIMHINSVLSILNSLGIGPEFGFGIGDASAVWSDFLGSDASSTFDPRYNSVKTYVYLRVRLLFDPPQTSYLIAAMQEQVRELEYRLSVQRESTTWVNPSGFLSPADLREGTLLAFIWDGTRYQPEESITDITRQKWFTGPVDPRIVGAYMAPYDTWIDTS